MTGQAAAPCRRCTQHSAARFAQPCPCAMTAHVLRTHLAVQGGQFLQLSAMQTVHALPVTLCCNLTSASMPFLTSAARNDAASRDSGAGSAHPSKQMSSMSIVLLRETAAAPTAGARGACSRYAPGFQGHVLAHTCRGWPCASCCALCLAGKRSADAGGHAALRATACASRAQVYVQA